MAKIAPIQTAITEKIALVGLTEEKRKGFKPVFVVVPVVVTAIAAVGFFVVRRFRSTASF